MADEDVVSLAVDQLLKDANVQLSGDQEKADNFRRQVGGQLTAIGKVAREADSGGAKVLITEDVSIRLGGTVWPLLVCVVTFVTASFDPTGLTYGAAGAAIVNALRDIGKAIQKLDPAQRVVCRAVIEVVQEKRAKANTPEASADEVRAHFKKLGQIVPTKLDDILSDLVKAEVLRKTDYVSTGTYYQVSF